MMSFLTTQLNAFSKGRAPAREKGSISEFIKGSVAFALQDSCVKCEFHIPDDLWLVEFDEDEMGQAIRNIVSNADKSMLHGGTIEVRAENVIKNADTQKKM